MISVNDYYQRVIVINLDRREDRMEVLNKRLEVLGIKYLRYSAIDAKALKISAVDACRKSHLNVIRRYAGERTLILEDDARFVDNFSILFDKAIRQAPDADINYLGALMVNGSDSYEQYNDMWVKQKFTSGFHAYSINPKLMDHYADKLEEAGGNIDMQMQILAADKSYICYPNLVEQFASYSDIRGKEVNDFE